jgi:hypothetical protein
LSEEEIIYVDVSDPVSYIGNALQALKIPRILERKKDQPEGVISITIEGGFPD